MPRIPKRLLALGGLIAGSGAAASALRKRRAGRPATPAPSATASAPTEAPAPAPAVATPAKPPAPPAASAPASESAPIAPPPVETPGPSVTPPQEPASSTEHEERADARSPDPEVLRERAGGPVDELVERETAAAAAQARGIGGPHPGGDAAGDDPAMSPVYEAGGGEAEGFEQAEADLIENASHGAGGANPLRDAFSPEAESDEATAVDAEADEEKVSEVVRDATTGAVEAERPPDDPGTGPGITHER
jgi:hypothetical protein